MGWWSIEQADTELLQGDEPYDLMDEALIQIVQSYQQDWDRKPTLAEIVKTVEVVLGSNLEAYTSEEALELTKFEVRTKKRRKSQPFQVGDFFTIPLGNGQYGFGRILSDLKVKELGMLIGVYNRVSRHVLPLNKLQHQEFMFEPFYCSDEGWESWLWQVIGNKLIEIDEFEYPRFKQGFEKMGWWIVEKDEKYEATEEEVKDLEYAEIHSVKAVENRIKEYLGEK